MATKLTDFPILASTMNGKQLVYLDNAATTQKPIQVIEALDKFYRSQYATVHRGVYDLSQQATLLYDGARTKVQKFLNAKSDSEIVFTKGATESINLVAYSYGRKFLKPGQNIVISEMEHHSNIVPWQQLGIELRVIPINERGELGSFEKLIDKNTGLVAVMHVSNALGTINDVKPIIEAAHRVGAKVLIDGAQAVAHIPVDVQALDCDFYVFSGHKLYGPSGVGVLYGKLDLLNIMDPFLCGGDMIESVTFEKTTFAKPPMKFEAGTPAVGPVIGLGAAVDYVLSVGFEAIERQETGLLNYATEKLSKIPSLTIIGTAAKKSAVISFILGDIHSHDIGTVLDSEGIAIRVGHHCAQPVMRHFGVAATARASFAFYNTKDDVDALVAAIQKAREVLG